MSPTKPGRSARRGSGHPEGTRERSSGPRKPRLDKRSSFLQWFWFALQLLAVAALQFGDDIVRGNIDPPNMQEAIRHAQEVAHLEQAHGFFVEPALQLSIRHSHALFGLLSYGLVVRMTDLVYALGQTLVPLLLALWIFVRYRSHFPLVRNITFLSTLLALVGYEPPPHLRDSHPVSSTTTTSSTSRTRCNTSSGTAS